MTRPVLRPQWFGVPAGMRQGFISVALAAFASLGLFGALAGQFMTRELDIHDRVLTSAVVFAAFGTAAASQVVSA